MREILINGMVMLVDDEEYKRLSNSQHQMSQRKAIGKSSQYKGVCWHTVKRKWISSITKNYRNRHLGYFTNEINAAHAYDEAAKELFGEYARLNFGDE